MGQCGSFSTFFSHHLNTMEGGVVVTDDEETYHVLLSLRSHGWTRGQPESSKFHRGDEQGWEFVLPGYNVRPMEVSSAIGRVQLQKLDSYMEHRRRNAQLFCELFAGMENIWVNDYEPSGAHFGFAMFLDGGLAPKRDALRAFLDARGVGTRPVVSGNAIWHPFIHHLNVGRSKPGMDAFKNSQNAHRHGIMIGNHNHDASGGLRYVRECVGEFLERLS
jgi:CDP-6-deoxy-D-xylo-4-hexulose-3-dehydrase